MTAIVTFGASLSLSALLFAPLLNADSAPLRHHDSAPIRIHAHHERGAWDGWGTSLCWWAQIFGDRDDLADLFFTLDEVEFQGNSLPGLGMNIARYNAGACSWNQIEGRAMRVSEIIHPFRQMAGFWLDGLNPDPDSKSWDWSLDPKQRAMLLKARDRGADEFELFSNAPMWWMCANDNPSGAAQATLDNLPPENYPAFATYLATIARYAQDHWNLSFTAVSPFNEPSSAWWHADCKQEGCHFSHAAQAAFLPQLRAELDRQGLHDLPITASDESYYDEALATWKHFDPEIKALIPRVNVHGYQDKLGDRSGLYQSVVLEDGKRLWNSEHGDNDALGLKLARNFHRDMAQLHPSAWCYWQPLDGGGWGMIEADLLSEQINQVNPKFFVFAQYARHIRPGMTVLDTAQPNTVAAYSACEQKLVIVTFNDGPAQVLDYDLSDFAITPTSTRTSWITEPAGQARYEPTETVPLHDTLLSASFPANAIQTFELSNIERIPQPEPHAYLFSYFRDNGQDGLHLAYSEDGLVWQTLNQDKSFLTPAVGGKLMRDPCITQGPDGTFHMVWTDSWSGQTIGYAASKDLIHWSQQQSIPVMKHAPSAKNSWAPEIIYDPKREQFLIFWASTIPEQFTQTWYDGKNDNNHRIYATTTKDFAHFSPTELFFDPGFNVIDSTLLPIDDKFYMIFKDETRFPSPQKNLHLAVADDIMGPYSVQAKPITPPNHWVEGPSALHIDGATYLYFDVYTKHRYAALSSQDLLQTWHDTSPPLSLPEGARHGTAFKVSQQVLNRLIQFDAEVH